MTPSELNFLVKEWNHQCHEEGWQEFHEFLLHKMAPRHPQDKVLRCLNCGTCVPEMNQNIYSEFCSCCHWVNKV